MSDRCFIHKRPLADCNIACVHVAIDGREVFAWWPVAIRDRGGWYMKGMAWLTTVIKRRRIGHPSYFYNRKQVIE